MRLRVCIGSCGGFVSVGGIVLLGGGADEMFWISDLVIEMMTLFSVCYSGVLFVGTVSACKTWIWALG